MILTFWFTFLAYDNNTTMAIQAKVHRMNSNVTQSIGVMLEMVSFESLTSLEPKTFLSNCTIIGLNKDDIDQYNVSYYITISRTISNGATQLNRKKLGHYYGI